MNSVKTFLLMTSMMILFIFVGGLLGGKTGMTIAFIFSLAMNFGSYWFSDKIVLSMYKAQPVTPSEAPEIYSILEKLANKAGLPVPKLYIINNDTPNAFATGRNPQNSAVALTTGIVRILNSDELEGVIAHELSHIKNRDILIGTIAATLVGTISLLARLAGYSMMFAGGRDDEDSNGLGALVLLILSPIIAILIQMSISRSREYMADSTGAQISGKPLALASALRKLSQVNEKVPMRDAEPASAHMFIVNPLSGKSIMSLFSTHPSIEKRVAKLEEIASGRAL